MEQSDNCNRDCKHPCGSSCDRVNKDRYAYGGELAREAIVEMSSDTDMAKGFVEKCEKTGRDPLEVLSYIAVRNDIDLTKEAPEDPKKQEIYRELTSIVNYMALRDQENADKGDRIGFVRMCGVDIPLECLARIMS